MFYSDKTAIRVYTTSILTISLLLVLIISASTPSCSAPATGWTWIWADGKPKPPETIVFRHHFKLSRTFTSARLLITADDSYRAFLNGNKKPFAQAADFTVVHEYDITRQLIVGDNLFAVECTNTGGAGGLIYKIIVKYADGKLQTIFSDKRVRANRRPPPEWMVTTLDDSQWPEAFEVAPANSGVWGPLRGAVQADPSHIVRLWNLRAGGSPTSDSYLRKRGIGDRMLLSANEAIPSDMQILAQAGFSLFQTDSDHLSTEQVRQGRWDFTSQLASKQTINGMGLDWSYFPHAAFPPEWYRKTVPFTRLQCLEHKLPVEAFSIWDPTWPGFIDQEYAALAKEFLPKQAANALAQLPPSALYVGVHGDYGEAGLMMGGRVQVPGQKEDWLKRFGNLEDHIGWWCNDPLARADFRASMLQKYGTLAALNITWKRDYKKPEELDYPPAPRPEARLEWLDFVEWYQGSVGKAIELNLGAARKYFPQTLLMLPAGFADENPRGGNDNSLIPKLAAKYGAEVRSTHGAFKPFPDNAATMYGRLGSACRFYGVPFWSEPTGILTPNQEVEHMFEAVSQGTKGMFDWNFNGVANRDIYFRYGKYLRVEKPVVDVAMFYPSTAQRLRPNEGYAHLFGQACAYVRDIANFDIVDDRMVQDDCLANYRVLALWEGTMADQATLDKIKAWVRDGGVLLAYDFGKVSNLEGDTPWYSDKSDLFGYIQELAPAKITERYVGIVPAQYRVSVGDPNTPSAADYLAESGDGWYEPEALGGIFRRWTRAKASLNLPVDPAKQYNLVVRAFVPSVAASLRRRVLVNGVEVGQIGSPGDVTYRFLLPEGVLNDKKLMTVTFESETFQPSKLFPNDKDARDLGVDIQYVQVAEFGSVEDANAALPAGTLHRELDLSRLKTQWSRLYGKGLTIYFPANRRLLKGYIEVLRRAIYHLSDIESGRKDAPQIDDSLDGVYATLFTNKILYYNSKDMPVTKKVTIPDTVFEEWKDVLTTPTQNTWTITVPAHGIEAINFEPQPQELLFESEEFKLLGGLKPTASLDCSPGEGNSCVIVPKGGSISTRIVIDTPGEYRVFTRCLNGKKLEAVDVLVDDKPITPLGVKTGQTMWNGLTTLSKGNHVLTLRAKADHSMKADFVILSNDLTISGYDFALVRASLD